MNTILIVLSAVVLLWLTEQARPARRLPRVPGWYRRSLLLNSLQAGIALLAAVSWDRWLAHVHLTDLSAWPLWIQGLIGYLLITFVFYWWHRARHSVPLLWRWLHQTHHSASRLEVITSFYKHPLEVLINSLLSSCLLIVVLGLSPEAIAASVALTGLAELFYHMNLSTPRWLGLFFQRPEMHRVHHQRGVHRSNFSDLPVWDMLFGTWHNPHDDKVETGFPDLNECRLTELLGGRRMPS